MKKIVTSILCLLCCLAVLGQSSGESVVRQFGNNLQTWCSTKDTDYRMRARKQCEDACRVSDIMMKDYAAKKNIDMSVKENCEVPSYLNIFEDAFGEGNVSFSMSNVRTISNQEQSYSFSYGTSTVKQEEKRSKDIITVACDIAVNGTSMNYHIKDLYYIRKGKIAKITPYEEIIDQKTGKKKVKVDFSDIEDTSMLGFTINHDQHFPIGASIIGQSGWFMCSLDFGINLDSKKYLVEKMDMTNIMNYSSNRKEYDPKMFLTLTPAVFLKYVSVGCGVGFVWLDGKEETSERKSKFDDNGNYSGYTGGSTSTDAAALKFMLRPQVRGYIPLSSSCNMSIGVGYDIVPKMKDLNGYNVSVGFHFDFDEWEDFFSWW